MKRTLTLLLILALLLALLGGCAQKEDAAPAQETPQAPETPSLSQVFAELPAIRVDGTDYSVADFAYYYYGSRSAMLSSGYPIDASTSLRSQASFDGSQTWYDYLVSTSSRLLAQTVVTARAAEAAGFDGGAEAEQAFQDTMAQLADAAANYGCDTDAYLGLLYGSLMTAEAFERNLRMSILADAYHRFLSQPSAYTDAELDAAYDADPAAYTLVSYESVLFLAGDGGDTDAAAQKAADALSRIQAGEAPEAVAADTEGTYSASSAASSGGSDLNAWLFEDGRAEGDSAVLDYYGVGSIVAVYRGKGRADYHSVDVRHILVADEETANGLLAQFNAGDRSEESFAALAKENSTDPGSASNGGLYTGVYMGQMVKPFEDWCFDASRKVGDAGVVKTDYGYHVMYYSGCAEYAYWQELAAKTLGGEKISALAEAAGTELLEDGLKYIDPQ